MEKEVIIADEGGVGVEMEGPRSRTRSSKKKKVYEYNNELIEIKELLISFWS